jgi:hypothetical protein
MSTTTEALFCAAYISLMLFGCKTDSKNTNDVYSGTMVNELDLCKPINAQEKFKTTLEFAYNSKTQMLYTLPFDEEGIYGFSPILVVSKLNEQVNAQSYDLTHDIGGENAKNLTIGGMVVDEPGQRIFVLASYEEFLRHKDVIAVFDIAGNDRPKMVASYLINEEKMVAWDQGEFAYSGLKYDSSSGNISTLLLVGGDAMVLTIVSKDGKVVEKRNFKWDMRFDSVGGRILDYQFSGSMNQLYVLFEKNNGFAIFRPEQASAISITLDGRDETEMHSLAMDDEEKYLYMIGNKIFSERSNGTGKLETWVHKIEMATNKLVKSKLVAKSTYEEGSISRVQDLRLSAEGDRLYAGINDSSNPDNEALYEIDLESLKAKSLGSIKSNIERQKCKNVETENGD